tara:strand:+ start:249 stop:470 length:222 start_codon:yes stop_codon:yes gene_type:complete
MTVIFSFILRVIIIFYQKSISPFFLPRCRFSPTCSNYGLQAIKKHGPWRGFCLLLKRILSCHPWGGDGYNPVP